MIDRVAEVDRRRTDTRDRLLSVALGLFARQGYATTSLREIADALGVTKAAVYFHYRTKEDILTGIMSGHTDTLNALLDDAIPRTSTLAGREELLCLYADYHAAWGLDLTRLARQTDTEISSLPIGAEIRRTYRRLLDGLAGPDPTVLDQTRARTALAAIQTVALAPTLEDDEHQLRDAALTIGLEVLRQGQPTMPPSASRTIANTDSPGTR